MISSFNHKGLEGFFVRGSYRAIPAQYAARIERMLDRLDSAIVPEDMDLPGFKFHELKGKRKGVYSITVSGNWRITFKFDRDSAIEVDFEDYH
jgi:proteic killer suppression protein